MLVKQNELGNDNGSQRQELRTIQTLDWHLDVPGENGFEEVIEGFNGLRTQFVEDTPNLNPVVGMGMFATPGHDQKTVVALTIGTKIRVVVMRVAQDKPDLFGQLREQQWCNCGLIGVSDGQLRRQGYPDPSNGDSQMEFPAIPPTMPARFAPPSLRIKAAVRYLTTLSMFLVPYAATRLERSTVHGRGASVLRKRPQFFHQGSSQTPYQAWQALWQRLQAPFPSAPRWKSTLLAQQSAHVLADAILLCKEGQQCAGTV